MGIRVISTQTIKPSSPTPGHLTPFKLSLLDRHMIDTMYMPCIFFYPPPGGSTTSSSVERLMEERSSVLKSSLAQTLTRFYPLAGRLSDSSPVVRCNDEGVPFSVAAIDGTMASFLSRRGAAPDVDALEQFLPFPAAHLTEFQDSAPQLGARATFFACGGVVIGICCFHKLIDAHTMLDFMNLWTAFVRGVGGGGGAYAHNRAATSLFPVPDDDVSPQAVDLFGVEEEGKKRVTRRFVFDGEAISALKDIARSGRVPHPTRSEVVAGFVWQSAVNAAARALGGEGKAVAAVHSVGGMTVDLRPRMKVAWPDYSVGNMFWFPPLAYHDKLQKVVSESRDAIEKVEKGLMAKLEGGDGRGEFLRNREAWGKASMANPREGKVSKVMVFGVSSLVGKGVYEVDFGWGKPVWYAMATYGDKLNNVVLLIESPIGYGVEAWLTLLEQDMLVLERDPEFLAYANNNASVPYAGLARL